MLAVVHPVLADRGARVRREILERRRVGGAGDYDDRELERAGRAQLFNDLRHRRVLLADGDVDALHLLRRSEESLLVDDAVDRDGRLAGLPVADDQLALAAADRGHRVDRFDAEVQRLLHRLALDDRGRLHLELPVTGDLRLVERRPAVDRVAEHVHNATEQRVADGDREDAPRELDRVAFFDLL